MFDCLARLRTTTTSMSKKKMTINVGSAVLKRASEMRSFFKSVKKYMKAQSGGLDTSESDSAFDEPGQSGGKRKGQTKKVEQEDAAKALSSAASTAKASASTASAVKSNTNKAPAQDVQPPRPKAAKQETSAGAKEFLRDADSAKKVFDRRKFRS
eukprot:s690_g26.t1